MTSPMPAASGTTAAPVIHLARLIGRPLMARDGDQVGRVDDVIVRLRDEEYPLVTGVVARVGGRRVYVSSKRIATFGQNAIALAKEKVDLRSFERRDGEVLLREDILGHRLIDVADVELVRAYDVELVDSGSGWVLTRLDTRRPARLFGLLRAHDGHAARDWKAFEPLLGHQASALQRARKTRLRRLKPAQIADLLEDADRDEGSEILDQVHADPELEADVFEELDPDVATKLLEEKSDREVASVLARMRADDAADAIAELRQRRRTDVLALLPAGQREKILTLMGFNPSSAGGLMNTDLFTCAPETTAGEALLALAAARAVQEEALYTVHAVDGQGRLVGVATVTALLRGNSSDTLADLLDTQPVRVTTTTDVADIALLMADFNLVTVPVVDHADLLLGVVTIDDVLEATIPDDWRRREPEAYPSSRVGALDDEEAIDHAAAERGAPQGPLRATSGPDGEGRAGG